VDLPDRPALPGWDDLPFWEDGWPGVQARLLAEARPWLPAPADVFAALSATRPDAVRVVILGQDPYPTPGHAHGFAFSVAPGVAPPRSLANILAELRADLGAVPPDGDLRGWAAQGVLLLNTVLTVPVGDAGGHGRIGWQGLTAQVLDRLGDRPRAFVLWGRPAQALRGQVPGDGHLFVESAHPSPLSARRGFFGSRPFSRVNDWLAAQGQAPVDWARAGG